jgi:spectinomycin phosphotransferase
LRESPDIPEEHLRTCLQDQYGLSAVALDFLPLGLDTRAGVYRVVSEQGIPYLLKAKSGSLYEPSCLVPGYLRDQGIASVVAPLPTRRNTLWAQAREWAVILYPFIEGDSGWDPPMTDVQWRAVGMALNQIHQVRLPSEALLLPRRETFNPTKYSRWVHAFDTPLAHAKDEGRIQQELRGCWAAHQTTIHTAVTSLETLAAVLQGRSGSHIICHADLHPGNIIRDPVGRVFVIDWDDVMLAPKERDFIFVGEASSSGLARQDLSPFFQGYGPTEIDWAALTYYLWERAVQDLIECAEQVFFRDDLGEETKADAVRLFRDILSEGNEVDAALSAATHL